jgi:hypothetical protein
VAKRAYDVVVATARVSVARGVAPTPHAAAIPVTLTTWPASSCVCPPGAVTLTMSGTCVDCQLTPDTRLLSVRDPGDAYASPPDRGRLWCVWEGNPDAITRTLLVYRVYRVLGGDRCCWVRRTGEGAACRGSARGAHGRHAARCHRALGTEGRGGQRHDGVKSRGSTRTSPSSL